MRKEFITAKYVDHKFARKTCTSAADKMSELYEAVRSRDLLALIQVYAEGVELMEPLPEAGQVRLLLLGRRGFMRSCQLLVPVALNYDLILVLLRYH